MAGVTDDIVVTFTTANDVANDGDIVITFPSGFDLSGTVTVVSVGGDLDGNTSIAVSSPVVTVTRTGGGGTLLGGETGIIVLAGIRNPTVIGDTGAFTIQTQTSGAEDIDEDTAVAQVTITHDTAAKYVIIDPTDGTVDAAITVTVEIQDTHGNRVTTGAETDKDVTLVTDLSATGEGVVNITAGTGSLAISDQVAETVTLTLTAPVSGSLNIGSNQNVVFANGVGTQFVILDPNDGTVDDPIDVTVELRDQHNNLVTTGDDKDKDVTLVTSGSATGAGLVPIVNGTGLLAISDIVVETVNLSLSDSAGTGFTVTSTQDVIYAHGIPASLAFATQPQGGPSRVATGATVIGTQPIVEVLDQHDNRVTTDPNGAATERVLIVITDPFPTGTVLSGPATVDVDWTTTPGTVAFADLALNAAGTFGFTATAVAFTVTLGVSEEFEVIAANLFVDDVSGVDADNDCLTAGTPCKTIQTAIGEAQIGDIVKVQPGTYTEDLVITTANVTLRSTGGRDVTTIQMTASGTIGIDIPTAGNGVIIGGATGQGFTIKGGAGSTPSLIQVNDADDVLISFNALDTGGNAKTGIKVGPAGDDGTVRLTIDNNSFVVDDNDEAIFGTRALDLTISNNTLKFSHSRMNARSLA